MDSSLRELTTTRAIFEELGDEILDGAARVASGVSRVVELTGRTTNAVHNWKSFNKFPSNTFVVLHDALRSRGATAPASLWGMVEPRDEATSEAAQ